MMFSGSWGGKWAAKAHIHRNLDFTAFVTGEEFEFHRCV
jgi:hypothetical protein